VNSAIRVWAPFRNVVEVLVGESRMKLDPDPKGDGWWSTAEEFPPGSRYWFILDGEGPYPDPRSKSQPDGVHGSSEIVDHGSRAWIDRDWSPPPWEDAVVYELHVGSFSDLGTFRAAISHLDDLVDLGVCYVELMPVCEFSGKRGWGYDGVNLFAPHGTYGGVEGLKDFVEACHSRGLGVLLDVVYNHLGPEGNYLSKFGPYFTDRHPTPWGAGPNLDGSHSAQVRRFFIDNALMWLRDYHVDGLRLDAVDRIVDESVKHFLAELREEVDSLAKQTGIPRVLVAESAVNSRRFVEPVSAGGFGMDAQWNDDFHHSLRTLFTGEEDHYYLDYGSVEQVVKALQQGFVYDGVFSRFRGQAHGESPRGLHGSQFLAYLQTHDQIGNRARGDRFHQHSRVDLTDQKIAAAFVLLGPFIPMVFMGEEWAASTPFQYFTDHGDPALAEAVRIGRREEFGAAGWDPDEIPDPQAPSCFEASRLRWDERSLPEHSDMLGWYRALLELRSSDSSLGCSDGLGAHADCDPKGSWLWMKRGKYLVVACLDSRGASVGTGDSRYEVKLCGGIMPEIEQGRGLIFPTKGIAVMKEVDECRPEIPQ
jgi:maltooligosyltrehalose trehalohydrolase